MKKNSIIIMAAGLVLLAVAAAKVGFVGLLHNLAAGWIALPILVGLGTIRLGLQTYTWSSALRAEEVNVRARDLVGARLASRGMGYLSVLGPMVAEPMKIKLLGDSAGNTTAPTLIDTGVSWFSSGVIAIAGSLFAMHALAGGRHSFPLILVSASTALGLIFIARPKPLLPGVIRLLGKRCPACLKQAEGVELAIRDFETRHPDTIRMMLLVALVCQILMVAEIAVIIVVFKLPLHVGTVMALEAANRVVRTMGAWLPAHIGADETGMAAAFLMFGLPSASGLALALARRIRDLIEVFVGFGWLAWTSRSRAAQLAGPVETSRGTAVANWQQTALKNQ
jgi:lysylphosphatidylglycerol synthase-like protein